MLFVACLVHAAARTADFTLLFVNRFKRKFQTAQVVLPLDKKKADPANTTLVEVRGGFIGGYSTYSVDS